ncbi:MAG: hypothetical protein HKL80_03055 [Acidimicrobiales bacterium]|nr:hypothetical protein [Acidimicrobiales bacterium]
MPNNNRKIKSSARVATLLAAFALVAGIIFALTANGKPSKPLGPSLPIVQFDQSQAVAFNGKIPTPNATAACGRNQYGFIAEIQYVGITNTKITKHYGPIIPLANGLPKQMEASGVVTDGAGGNNDFPFDHEYGGDFSFDVSLDSPYASLSQGAGTSGGTPSGIEHMEIQTGELPHLSSDPLTQSIPPGETWPEYATAAQSGVIPGFQPQAGDAVAAQGDWIIDCGHTDFHSEFHEATFLAFGHDSNGAAVVHAFYNPYIPSEIYNPNPNLAPEVNNPSNLALSNSKPLVPDFLVQSIVSYVQNKSTAPIVVPELIEGSTTPPAPFTVCAPTANGKTNLSISYQFNVRPGVNVSETQDNTSGCATFTTTFSSTYQTAPPQGETMCPVSWTWLNQNAGVYAQGGSINLQQTIYNDASAVLPQDKSLFQALLQHRIHVTCYNMMSSSITSPTSGVQAVSTVTNQLYPIIGWVQAKWN